MRRRMMMKEYDIEDIIYKLSTPVIFNGSNNIDTGLHLYQDYDNFTFFVDIGYDASEQVGTVGSPSTIVSCMHEITPWPGFTIRHNPEKKLCRLSLEALLKPLNEYNLDFIAIKYAFM